MRRLRSHHRSKEQKAADRQRVAELRLRSFSIDKIAEAMGCGRTTVRRDLAWLQAKWEAEAAEDIAALKARELKKLDHLEAEALAEWERSKLTMQKVVKEVEKGVQTKERTEVSEQCGDPRYLNVMLGIQERRAKLVGADMPTKVAPTTPDGQASYSAMPDAELDRRIAELSAKGGAVK